jgi:PIN domain nuclease of toxin-antitoxin system
MSALLLDTHVLLWANADPGRLGASTTAALLDPGNDLYVSAISALEAALKRSIGKLDLRMPVEALLEALGAKELALTIDHAGAIERLPMLHRDPFDRVLAAQATTEGFTLVTADERLLGYPVDTMDARS